MIVGLVVAAIVSTISWLFRKRLLKRIRGIQQIYGEATVIFDSARDAVKDIRTECIRSKRIRYVGDYNSTFINARYPQETLLFDVLNECVIRRQQPCLVQFLHFSPRSKFIDIRARELNYASDEIRNGVISALRNVQEAIRQLRIPKETVQVRHYDFQVLLRAVILDHCCFLGFYKVGRMGGFSPLIKIKPESELYGITERYFDILWEHYSYPGEEDAESK